MKLTPEQKAFFEYGKASESLKKRIAKVRHDARYVFGEPYCYLTCTEKKNLWITSDLKSYIQDYRQKRAACKAWNPIEGRDCPNCKYHDLLTKQYPCQECYLHEDQRLWEPRKAADDAGANLDGNPHNSLENVKAPWGKTMADGKEGM